MLRRAESFNVGKSPRNIAAPFQVKVDAMKVNSLPGKDVKNDHVDYTNFNFVPLEAETDITFEKYVGPTPESNWVVPGVLLVGAYPASQDDAETFELITSILKLGVTKFVCLQQEYRSHGVTEEMWRNGHALRPYFEDVRLVVQLKSSIPELNGFEIVDEKRLSFVHFPIKDCGITDDGRVLELARNLVKAISEKEIIYLHCWGGHGRTGTLVCIMLHLMYGLGPVEAMARCQVVHDLRQCPVVVGSPQTQPQRDQVTRIINRLTSHTRYLRRTLSEVGMEHQLESEMNSAIDDSQHSPRSPEAAAITHSKGVGHAHFLLGHPQGAAPAVEDAGGQLQSSLPGLPPVDESDPWDLDAIPQFDDVDDESEDEAPKDTPVNMRSFRGIDTFQDFANAAEGSDLSRNSPELVAESDGSGTKYDEISGAELTPPNSTIPVPPDSAQRSIANGLSGGGLRMFRSAQPGINS